jgi:hypothetical protein
MLDELTDGLLGAQLAARPLVEQVGQAVGGHGGLLSYGVHQVDG